MSVSTRNVLKSWHRDRSFHPGIKVVTVDASQLGYVTCAPTANAVSDKWQGVITIPLDTADEVHYALSTPPGMDINAPFYVRLGMITVNADDSVPLTITIDKVHAGATAADGATAASETLPDYTAAANIVGFTKWAKFDGIIDEDDYIFIKVVAGTVINADGAKVVCLQYGYEPIY
jgi:hypothetical protein